ncbi:DNA-binding protein [Pseudomonas sp. NPDC096950]|uniref:DNA-binding protein n=1 Tax=Pseudomonas sp. NPDC096950 TaxID=3364485 RepID=UPI00383BB6BE
MTRASVEQVALAVKKMLAGGESITVRRVREITGGSFTTISNHLKLPGVRDGTFEISNEAVEIALRVNRQKKIADKMLNTPSDYPPSAFHASSRVDSVVDDELFALAERFRKLQDGYDVLISEASRALAAARDRIQIYARKVEWMEMERARLLTENRQIRAAMQYLHPAEVDPDFKCDE